MVTAVEGNNLVKLLENIKSRNGTTNLFEHLNKMYEVKKEMNDDILDKYLSAELKKSLWTEDYDGCYEYWLFRTYAQDSKPDNDVSKIEGIKELGDGWYEVKYLDMGWNGTTKVKVKEDKIVEFVKDQSWDGEY